jgi:hypothetical protein
VRQSGSAVRHQLPFAAVTIWRVPRSQARLVEWPAKPSRSSLEYMVRRSMPKRFAARVKEPFDIDSAERIVLVS